MRPTRTKSSGIAKRFSMWRILAVFRSTAWWGNMPTRSGTRRRFRGPNIRQTKGDELSPQLGEERDCMGRELPQSACRDGNLGAAVGFEGIEQSSPRAAFPFGQRELDRLGSRIERQDMSAASPIRIGASEGAAEAVRHRVLPIPKLHFAPVRPQPNDVFELAAPLLHPPREP